MNVTTKSFHSGIDSTRRAGGHTPNLLFSEAAFKSKRATQDSSSPQQIVDHRVSKAPPSQLPTGQLPIATAPRRTNKPHALRTNDNPTAHEMNDLRLVKQKCAFATNMITSVKPNDLFGNSKDDARTYIDKGKSMNRISREHHQLHSRTIESKHVSYGGCPTDHFRNGGEVHSEREKSEEQGLSQGYERLDRSTMEPRHGTPASVSWDHFCNDRDPSEAYLGRERSVEKGVSGQYEKLDKNTMEIRHERLNVVHVDHLDNVRHANATYFDMQTSTNKGKSREYKQMRNTKARTEQKVESSILDETFPWPWSKEQDVSVSSTE